MIADLAFHSPEKEDGGIPNPHFHVMTTMRPLWDPKEVWALITMLVYAAALHPA